MGEGGRMGSRGTMAGRRTKTARSDDYDRRISSFMSAPSLYSPRSFSSSPFFSRENYSTDLSSENDAKKTGRRGFGDPSSRIGCLYTECTARIADLGLPG